MDPLVTKTQSIPSYHAVMVNEDTSAQRLNQLGYKQDLRRTLSSFATFGLAFTNIGILSNTSATFQTVLQRGGPVVMLVSWNIVAVFMICIALSLSEICSLYPTSGGLYYWVYELLHRGNNKKKAPIIQQCRSSTFFWQYCGSLIWTYFE
ncbi:uncharacterized protein BYT42DRAFT_113067 [Radiomyces spectabilis]|uniref:uncharacterized protein n=1 Tax=Radiomyces spectabilis TaxID=64574 RepID=UPI002220F054|nr:uncharacterized protein BYT42DRAFT_113067 [Radiomyces spectabilis]KAI8369507.1 hypothetical protein BYT42DRAFT_113067 [Radiomyces spectabilis]